MLAAVLATPGLAQVQFAELGKRHFPAVVAPTMSLASGDVDVDGELDLIVGNTRSPGEQNLLYLNNGAGVFTDATASRLPVDTTISRALALADFDGDLDVVVGRSLQRPGL